MNRLIEQSLKMFEAEDQAEQIRKLRNRLATLKARQREIPDIKDPSNRQKTMMSNAAAIRKTEDRIRELMQGGNEK